SGPVGTSASTRYLLEADARKEDWDLGGNRLLLKKFETKLGLNSLFGSRGNWSSAVIMAAPGLGYTGGAGFDFIRWPEKRLVFNAGASVKAKRIHQTRFMRTELDGRLNWLPQARGSDFATSIRIRAGSATDLTPYDELFALGIDRDTELLLRGH